MCFVVCIQSQFIVVILPVFYTITYSLYNVLRHCPFLSRKLNTTFGNFIREIRQHVCVMIVCKSQIYPQTMQTCNRIVTINSIISRLTCISSIREGKYVKYRRQRMECVRPSGFWGLSCILDNESLGFLLSLTVKSIMQKK